MVVIAIEWKARPDLRFRGVAKVELESVLKWRWSKEQDSRAGVLGRVGVKRGGPLQAQGETPQEC